MSPRGARRAVPPPWVDRRPLVAADAVRVTAAHAPPTGGGRAVGAVVAHGFTGSLADDGYRRVVGWLANAGIGVVGVDFRGHGTSSGQTTVGEQEVLDVDAAHQWLRLLGYRHRASIGFSMGGAVVLRHAALHGGVDAVVSVSAPARWYYRGTTSMRRAHLAVEHPVGRLVARTAFGTRIRPTAWDPIPLDPRRSAARIDVPLLVVHGDADHYFPLEHGEQLAAAGSATLWTEPGYGHAENAASRELVERIAVWVREHVEATA